MYSVITDKIADKEGFNNVDSAKPELDIAVDWTGQQRGLAEWLNLCAQTYNLTDTQIAKAYVKLRHLTNPNKDDRKLKGRKLLPPSTRMKEYRTGARDANAETAYRIGRALQECGAPVTGLDALIAGHFLEELLGAVGSHISIGISRMTPPLHPLAPEIAHVLAMLDQLIPRVKRELIVFKRHRGIRVIDIEELSFLRLPLPSDELHPREATDLVDEGFMAWRYEREEYRQKLPPAFAATIALLHGGPTPEVVELASSTIANPQKDIMDLLGLITPPWVSRIRNDLDPTTFGPASAPDYTALNAFFAEFDQTFELPGTLPGCQRSATYPNVNVKLHESEYHAPATAIDVDWVVVDAANRGLRPDIAVIDYLKELAKKHDMTLVTWPADDDDSQRYHDRGFKICQDRLGLGRRLEWPQCAHHSE